MTKSLWTWYRDDLLHRILVRDENGLVLCEACPCTGTGTPTGTGTGTGTGTLPDCIGCPSAEGPDNGFSFDIKSGFNNLMFCDCEAIHGIWNIPLNRENKHTIWSCGGSLLDTDAGCGGGARCEWGVEGQGDGTYKIFLTIVPDTDEYGSVTYEAILNNTTACRDVSNVSMTHYDSHYWPWQACSGEEDLDIEVSAY